jgi:WD40 repeat protein
MKGHADWVTACAVTPDGKRVVSASNDQTLKVWELATGRALATLEGHTRKVTACAVTPDGGRVVSASWDKTLKVWDLESSACILTHLANAAYGAVAATATAIVAGDCVGSVWFLDWPALRTRPTGATQDQRTPGLGRKK